MLEKKQSLGHRLHAFAKELVKELRRISTIIPVKVFRGVATTTIAKYPDLFVQKDKENRVVSDSLELLVIMMRNHNNYLNSGCSRTNELRVPIRKRKAVNPLRNTVQNWSPAIRLWRRMTEDREKILLYMEDCFPVQRSYFKNQESYPSIEMIKANRPYIFTRECIYKHFSQLTETNFQKLLPADFTTEKSSLAKFFSKKNEAALEGHQEMEILNCISHHFKENLDFLIQSFPVGNQYTKPYFFLLILKFSFTDWNSVRRFKISSICAMGCCSWYAYLNYFILSFPGISYVTKTAYIFIEHKIVWSSDTPNIFDVLAQTIGYFYAFNIEYPKEVSQTIDFLVRCILNH
ncbi:LOW QUALITY PROTEIN: uncharacterized protein LOC129951975 [Eupeodes corollae]|uniref:LOW QUALITY PROTEIN: uncharacterized protein LOC129951975 n=1 Tax=Eupeodes corollae TaxID=290404 RepID=UPI0024931DA3|nr:LOW QUALITY PROTEIN: uncharacterized protein LOC129951975 [Eupeodes corollae]